MSLIKMSLQESSAALEVPVFDIDIGTQAEGLLGVRQFEQVRRVNWSLR